MASSTVVAIGDTFIRFSGPVTLHVQAGDNGQDFTVNVIANQPSITTAVLTDAVQGTAYSQTLTASGGVGPYAYAVSGGSLPAGLSLSGNGAFSGTPTAAGAFPFTVTVTDSNNALLTASKPFSLTVNAGTPAYTLPSAVSVITNNSPADGSTANVLWVQVYDSLNAVNAGAGVSVTWSVTSPNPATGITLVGGTTSTTNAQGIAEMRITDSGGLARSVTVQASVDGGGSGKEQSGTVNFTAVTYTLEQNPTATLYVGTQTSVPFVLSMSGNQPVAGVQVTLSFSGTGAFTTPPTTATTDSDGKFSVNLTGQTAGSVTVTASWESGAKSAQCVMTVANPTYSIAFDAASYSQPFSGNSARQNVIVTVLNTSGGGSTPVNNATVTFSASMNGAANLAVVSGRRNQFYGLTANGASGGADISIPPAATDANGKVTLSLEDIVGERVLTLTASVTPPGGSQVTSNPASVSFGPGQLQYFKAPDGTTARWSADNPVTSSTTSFPAAAHCGGTVSYTGDGYYASSNLPTVTQLKGVADSGAWYAADWPGYGYWTGVVDNGGYHAFLVLDNGVENPNLVINTHPVVCLR